MLQNVFYKVSELDKNIIIHSIQNEERLSIPKKLAERLQDEFVKTKENIIVFEEIVYGLEDIDNNWFLAYNSPEGIYLYEMTDDLLERANYGMK